MGRVMRRVMGRVRWLRITAYALVVACNASRCYVRLGVQVEIGIWIVHVRDRATVRVDS